jgi:hypothetical protein
MHRMINPALMPFGKAIPRRGGLRCACGTETARDVYGNPRQHKDPSGNPCEANATVAEREAGIEADADADARPCKCGLYEIDRMTTLQITTPNTTDLLEDALEGRLLALDPTDADPAKGLL